MEITIDKECSLCHGDGYLKFTVKQWENFLVWQADPSEEKSLAPHDVPDFLKIPCQKSAAKIDQNTMQTTCPTCMGAGKTTSVVSLEELKELLK
jgi:RecJ-like exonuclease